MRSLLVVAALAAAIVFPGACDGCTQPVVSEGEGEPPLDDAGPAEGEGEGEGEGEPPADPTDPDNDIIDNDCDGLSNEDEFGDRWPGGLPTDPDDDDTDGDGVPDGVEAGADAAVDTTGCAATPLDQDATSSTNPTVADSDGDCRDDGEEDANHNGRVDVGEGDPRSTDSDLDGLSDGAEDLDCDGVLDAGETDATDRDSDDDGLSDGFEQLIGSNPLDDDSDDDGIPDGDEVANGDDPIGDLQDADGDGIDDAAEIDNGTNPADADSDGDGLCDGNRDVAAASCVAGEDRDGDGLLDPGESDPLAVDTDCDGLSDRDELVVFGSSSLDVDTDGDGLTDAVEGGVTSAADATCSGVELDQDPTATTDPTRTDTDGDGLRDGIEDLDHDGALAVANPGGAQETDAGDPDTDGDGRCDGATTVAGTCVAGEDWNGDGRITGIETDPRVPDTDTDGDGITDARELVLGLDPADPDSDDDERCDGPGNVGGVCAAGEDLDGDGVLDPGETDPDEPDSDCDGVSDGDEVGAGSNPRDPDTDNDLLSDGVELSRATPVPGTACVGVQLDTVDATAATSSDPLYADTDQDGLPDGAEDRNHDGAIAAAGVSPRETFPRDPDSDDDGRCDGPLSVPASGCAAGEDLDGDGLVDAGETDPRSPEFDVDGDGLLSTIEALLGTSDSDADSDDDGLCDGSITVASASCAGGEDTNRNGAVDTGETDPTSDDSDCDALADGAEGALGTDPLDADSDNDLLSDGVERSVTAVLDCASAPVVVGAGAIATDPLDADSDDDGLNDGSEDRDHDGHLDAPVADPRTTVQETNPAVADTDGDGLCDGPLSVGACAAGEDLNRNGRVDGGETDPRVRNEDLDLDGLDDAEEVAIYGTDPSDDDTDDDGLLDGEEVQQTTTDPLRADGDCDGLNDGDEVLAGTDPLDPDTDGDGLSDGLESGTSCDASSTPPETDLVCNVPDTLCVADANATPGSNPLNPDTDGDGVDDGAEDANQNGAVDSGELDPNNGSDVGGADGNACSAANLRLVTIVERPGAESDLTIAVAPTFTSTTVIDAQGDTRGAFIFDAQQQIAGVAFATQVAGAAPLDRLLALEAVFEAQGDIAPGTTERQTFTSWDGNQAIVGKYVWSDTVGAADIDTSIVDLSAAITAGLSSSPAFPASTELGPYVLQVEVMIRPDQADTVVVLALGNQADLATNERAFFRLDDHSNGSSVATFGDDVGVQCDRFEVAAAQRVDFLLVVDNSGSMGNEQTAVATAAAEIGAQLAASTIDWRLGVVTTDLDGLRDTASEWDSCDPSIASITITAIDDSGTGGTLEVTTATAHGLAVSDQLTILNANSGSRDYNADYTVAQVISATSFRTAEVDPGSDNDSAGNAGNVLAPPCAFGNSLTTPRVAWCPFTTDTAAFAQCIDELDTNGNGAENGFRPVACAMGRTVTGTGIASENGLMCGRNTSRAPYADSPTGTLYQQPPSGLFLLPRAANDPLKLRTDATLSVIFISDAPEQSDGRFQKTNATDPDIAGTTDSLVPWQAFFSDYDGAGNAAFVAGIVCPDGTNCSDDHQNSRYQGLIAAMGGVERALPNDSVGNQAQLIADAIAAILNASIAQNSPYVLTKPPVSSTIKVATDAEVVDAAGCEASCETACVADGGTVGACDTACECDATGCTEIPRSTSDGFDYDGVNKVITFVGDCRPRFDQTGDRVAVSYRYWIPDLVDEDECVCNQPAPFVCINDTCVCPADCGIPGGVPPGQTCNPTTCEPECLPDCGGCPGATQCVTGSCTCACPAGCGGPAPGPGFTCDDGGADPSCGWVCEACPGAAPGPFSVCDFSTCSWACPGCSGAPPDGMICNLAADVCDFTCAADCGGQCDGNFSCDVELCQCECPVDCGMPSPGPGYVCTPSACEYQCPNPLPGANPPSASPGWEWDVQSCAYACNETLCDGTAAPGPEAICDAATCTWRCPADCGGCAGAAVCDVGACACQCPSGCGSPPPGPSFVCDDVVDCAWECPTTPPSSPPDDNPAFVWDTSTCDWECPADCGLGTLPPDQQCDRDTCTTSCRADCGGCGINESCDTEACACVCETTLSCAAGFVFDVEACQCVCDTAQDCGPTRVLDVESCSCVCHEDEQGDPDCNGCGPGTLCQQSLCECVPIGG